MITLLVLADDLTGANDTGVQFAKQHVSVYVTNYTAYNLESIDRDFSVVVVNTESRHLAPEEAAQRVADVTADAYCKGIRCFYKKTDSTLRGNIGAELDAVMKSAHVEQLIFVPAFPAAGRTTVHGFQLVYGTPVHETEFASDPCNPVRTSDIAALIAMQANRPVQLMKASETALFLDKRGIFLFDASTENDLIRISAALKQQPRLRVYGGAASFAVFLPDLLKIPRLISKKPQPMAKLLVVNGSLNRISLEQIARAKSEGISTYRISSGQIDYTVLDKITHDFRSHDTVSITSALTGGDIVQCTSGVCTTILGSLAEMVKEVLHRTGNVTLALFGGDTASLVLSSMGCSGLVPLSELCAGVTVSETLGLKQPLTVITKSGGFGGPSIIDTIRQFTKGRI